MPQLEWHFFVGIQSIWLDTRHGKKSHVTESRVNIYTNHTTTITQNLRIAQNKDFFNYLRKQFFTKMHQHNHLLQQCFQYIMLIYAVTVPTRKAVSKKANAWTVEAGTSGSRQSRSSHGWHFVLRTIDTNHQAFSSAWLECMKETYLTLDFWSHSKCQVHEGRSAGHSCELQYLTSFYWWCASRDYIGQQATYHCHWPQSNYFASGTWLKGLSIPQ